MCEESPKGEAINREQQFGETRWSMVLAAADSGAPGHDRALEELCALYWYPLYAYVRRRGHGPEDARDLTQGFFVRVIERSYLRTVDKNRGKFRSFLLGAMNHFLANERDRQQAKKRGGGCELIPR